MTIKVDPYTKYQDKTGFYCNSCGKVITEEPVMYRLEDIVLRFCSEDCMISFIEKRRKDEK